MIYWWCSREGTMKSFLCHCLGTMNICRTCGINHIRNNNQSNTLTYCTLKQLHRRRDYLTRGFFQLFVQCGCVQMWIDMLYPSNTLSSWGPSFCDWLSRLGIVREVILHESMFEKWLELTAQLNGLQTSAPLLLCSKQWQHGATRVSGILPPEPFPATHNHPAHLGMTWLLCTFGKQTV